MARVKIENGQLVINMKGMRKFFAMKGEVSVPLNNVESVTTGLAWKDLPGILDKIMGTNASELYYGGTFRDGGFWNSDGDKLFFDLKRKEEAIVITLKDEEFNKLIIGCDTPDETAAIIQKALDKKI
jgi:pyruvate dehydrogenase complex dehydrogenase (E1) component